MITEIDFELIQDDMVVAATSGQNALDEIMYYKTLYEQDGNVEVVQVIRTTIYATEWVETLSIKA